DEAVNRLRARLRAEVASGTLPTRHKSWREWFAGIFAVRIVLPAAITVALALLFGSLWTLNTFRGGNELRKEEITRAKLSDVLMEEAAGDHLTCARKFIAALGPAKMPDSVRDFDPAYVGLEQVAEAGATATGGMQLRSAHICGFKARRFAHLVYTRS